MNYYFRLLHLELLGSVLVDREVILPELPKIEYRNR